MSELKPPHDPIEAMGEAYELMLERTAEKLHTLEEKTGPEVRRLIDEAREKAVELGELSREEADKIADYLWRDLRDAAHYLNETGEEFKNWLGFETALIEDSLMNLFKQAADKTTLELIEMKEAAEAADTYHTGEITGPGTLVCTQCGEKLHFKKPGHIPPCPKCHATEFVREHKGT